MNRTPTPTIEPLESRTFLSATLESPAALAGHHSAVVTPVIPVVNGPTLHATAGTPFSGEVGFYQSGVIDPPDGYSATINWGDGSPASKATLSYGKSGNQFGVIISGVHTYAKAGNYVAKVTFLIGPISPKSTLPTHVIEYIVDKAVVTPLPPNTDGGVTLTETAGKKFTATIGNFTFIAPGTTYTATVTWGDGSTSQVTVTADGVEGIDVIKFKVTGTHTYALAGKYAIHISIYRPVASGNTAVPPVFTTIESTADVLGSSVSPA